MTTLTRFTQKIAAAPLPTGRAAYALIALWITAMIMLPIIRWIGGDDVIPAGVTVAALIQAAAVFAIVAAHWGVAGAGRAFVIVAIVTWAAEVIGSKTGIPFGEYSYTEALQPQIAGVPLLIPVAWFMLLPSAWVMAQLIVGTERQTLWHQVYFVIVSAVAMTAWDLFLDPQMVGWGFWVWAHPEGYFGIPWVNYLGWLLVSALVTAIIRPQRLPVAPLAFIYAAVWFLQSFGQLFFWNQPGPAIVGCLTMGSIMLLAYWRQRQSSPR